MSFFDKFKFSYSKDNAIIKHKNGLCSQNDSEETGLDIGITAQSVLKKEFFEEFDFDKEIRKNIDNLVTPALQVAYERMIMAETEDTPRALKRAKKLLEIGESQDNVQKMLLNEREKAKQKALFLYKREVGRYYAECKSRVESAKAYYRAEIERAMSDPDIFGFRWTLSSAHVHKKNDCICYDYSKMNIGYGVGIFPKNRVPLLPAHLDCMCHLRVVFTWEIEDYLKSKMND